MGLFAVLFGPTSAQASETDSELRFSKSMSNFLKMAERPEYKKDELNDFFTNIRTEGDKYCKFYFGYEMKGYKPDRFLAKKYSERKWCKGCNYHALRAGCWNFFKMNDRAPHRDFELVLDVSQSKKFDCYSVGFMQPYIMHTVLGCQKITAIDFDWRIHDAHNQVRTTIENANESASDANSVFGSLDIGWVAFGRLSKVKSPNSTTFCGKKRGDYCEEYMSKYLKSKPTSSFTLMNAPLHEMEVSPSDNTKVFYFSNATEKAYISRPQFSSLIKNIGSSLTEAETAYLIHHVGGSGGFGTYSLQRKSDKYVVSTICKDNYYHTYFEDMTVTKKNVPTCHKKYKNVHGPT